MNQVQFECDLQEGDECEARWTNCGNFYTGRATLVTKNKKSVRVRLLEPVGDVYPVGRIIVCEFGFSRVWSQNNGVFPRK